tara:strand:- start:195 stop:545 length:351 start_codon:yes stop_codon:yes gene_type:complete
MIFRNFRHNVERTDDKTVITVTDMNYQTAVLLLTKCLDKFGNWSHDTDVKLWGKDRMLNSGASFSISIPAPKNPRHTRDPFTKEYVNGYFAGLREWFDSRKWSDLDEEFFKAIGWK